ncbi:hypothetical protein AB1L30_00600, partial [Bremerella sp. JC817]|uniref:hypothetical protein n=1 Tax=Bremerella sp. JC817 TaxID=3231756 RepID=UPI0034574768
MRSSRSSAVSSTWAACRPLSRRARRINNFTVGENGFFQQDLHNYQVNLSKRNATGGLVSLRSVTQYD